MRGRPGGPALHPEPTPRGPRRHRPCGSGPVPRGDGSRPSVVPPGAPPSYTPAVPVCEICHNEYQPVTAFCPNCGAPLTALAARLREAGRRPLNAPRDETVVLPDLEGAETET